MRASIFLAAVSIASLAACGGSDATCTPGMSIGCVGTGGCSGFQVCAADGKSYGTCSCAAPMDMGTPIDMGTTDLGTPDAGGPCDPVAQTGCAPGERCTWARAVGAATHGHAVCAASGIGRALDPCAIEASTGIDDCSAGFACTSGSLCGPICDRTVGDPAGFVCALVEDFFSDALGMPTSVGIGSATCNPLTQARSDGAPACGSMPGGPPLGCVGAHAGPFLCGPIGDETHTQGMEPTLDATGHPLINGCAPGFIAVPADSTLATWVCTAYCTPAPTTMESHPSPAGLAPHDCTAAGSTFECRYDYFLSGRFTEDGNTYGTCYDYATLGLTSCTTISETSPDTTAYGCTPAPVP